jgi:hypothetical protein
MLNIYNTLEDVPEILREHYEPSFGKYAPKVSNDHPLVVNNKTLLNEKTAAETKAAGFQSELATAKADLESAKASGLPRGHVAITSEDAKLLESVKELGEGADTKAKVESIKTRLAEHATLKTDNETLKKTEQLRQVADSGIGGKKLKLSMLELVDRATGGLACEERDVSVTKDNKTTTEKVWHFKDGNKWVPLSDHPELKELGASLFAEDSGSGGGMKVPPMVPDDKSKGGGNIYADIRKQAEDRQKKATQEVIPLEKRLGQATA